MQIVGFGITEAAQLAVENPYELRAALVYHMKRAPLLTTFGDLRDSLDQSIKCAFGPKFGVRLVSFPSGLAPSEFDEELTILVDTEHQVVTTIQ
jgi:hypothetical protein